MRKFLLLPLLILVTGCGMVPFRKLVVADMLDLSTAPFYVVQEDAPLPEGVVSGKQELNELVQLGKSKKERLQIASPAEEIEKALTAQLIEKGQEQRVISFKGKKKPENVISWLHGKDITEGVVLDVQAGNWGMEPHPKDSTRYTVWLNAQMKLINIEENAVLAEYTCYSDTLETALEKAPTKYQLLKDDGALVKKMFRERAQSCTKEIIDKVLSDEKPAE
jgi:hypothetical protein